MIFFDEHHDAILRRRFESLTEVDKDYWSFKGNSRRKYGHGLCQYPAMMVPQVVESILKQSCTVHPEIEWVGDPFSGSGTIMTESMMRGLAFSGTDINPLAILLCRVKSGPFFIKALKEKSKELISRIHVDCRQIVDVSFPNCDKWFDQDVQIVLSKIQRAIRDERSLWARRFFWVALAETARVTSNSRTSTFKLHIRTQEDIACRHCDSLGIFKKIVARNIKHYEEQASRLAECGQLRKGRYQNEIQVALADVRKEHCVAKLDIIVTSPPYGDNTTTVPYGQYSYLPLQWIDLEDIGSDVDRDCLSSTHEIDTRSLGGSRRVKKDEASHLGDRSPSFRDYIESLDGQPPDRALRVTAFFRDLDASLDPILKSLRPGGLMVWTLGNRKVGGNRVPLDRILTDLLQAHKASILCKLKRQISLKRMALKNNIADTMSSETILVMRKSV